MDSYEQLLLSLGPSAWWPLGDAPGSATAADYSGNGNTGTVVGGVTFGEPGALPTVPLRTSALFDGSTGYVAIPTPTTATANVSLVAWVNMPATASHGALINLGSGDTIGYGIGIGSADWEVAGTDLIALYDQVRWVPSGHSLSTGWHMVALVLNVSGYPDIYVDGVSVYSDSSGAPAAPSGQSSIASNYGQSTRYWGGDIAEVAIFPTALTAAQVAALWAAATTVVGSARVSLGALSTHATGQRTTFASALIALAALDIVSIGARTATEILAIVARVWSGQIEAQAWSGSIRGRAWSGDTD